jgi:hypothetical protein
MVSEIEMFKVKQRFATQPGMEAISVVRDELAQINQPPGKGESIAIGVGSRGISNYREIVKATVDHFGSLGARPFLIPAMGSHGGATPEGQRQILAEYGITKEFMGVPIRAAMDSDCLGQTPSGFDIFASTEALDADHVFVINRIKPHTDFLGRLGSGCLKMLTIGVGKRNGAANYHQCSVRHGYEMVLREIGNCLLDRLPVLGGLALVEDQHHQTARIKLLQPDSWITEEENLFSDARSLMPQIPFADIDLLIVDRLGKNISGTGMDTNIIGREVHGYSTLVGKEQTLPPHIKRIYVRSLTPETHGNAIGIGMADFTRKSLVNDIDLAAMHVNSLTALTPHAAKIPITCADDEEAVNLALISAGVTDPAQARVVHINDTLNLESISISSALQREAAENPALDPESESPVSLLSSLGN